MTDKTLITDSRIYTESEKTLKNMGYNLIELDKQTFFDEPVSAHPDMLCVNVCGTWFVDNCVNDLFTFTDRKVIYNREVPQSKTLKYPHDVALNCAVTGNFLICNVKYTYPKITELAKNQRMHIIDVKQGYAKCSICIVSDNAIITEDINIYNACKEAGVHVLLIEKGHVKLEGYDYGFIGGCCGLIENKLLAFNGCIEKHPQYNEIKCFSNNHGVEILSLCDRELYDIGSILRV